MKDKKILINSPSLVKDFVSEATKVNGDVSLISENGRYVINGKSIMGIFSLNLSRPLYVRTEDNNKSFESFLKKIEA